MIIASVTLQNFRCFGPEPQKVELGNLTALLGANGAGKSAVLMALARLFGVAASDRVLEPGDFYRAADEDSNDRDEAHLSLEAVLQFPELADAAADAGGPAACFKHMTVPMPDGPPYCRIRLSGKWQKSNLPDGEIEQKLEWVTSPFGTKAKDEKTQQVRGQDRARIHVIYVPASRDPAKQIRIVSGSLLHRLLLAVKWSAATRTSIEQASDTIRKAFVSEAGVAVIHDALKKSWADLHAAPEQRDVAIRPVSRMLGDIIRQVEATFSPGPTAPEEGLERLSEGQKSLFYLSIVSALFDVQAQVAMATDGAIGIASEELVAPCLSLLAIEEPENHVAPHLLGRIMSLLRTMADGRTGQVVTTSHSSSIVARVAPEEIRHLRKLKGSNITVVRSVQLPVATHEAHSYVREAVRAYPELYFSRLVVLGEGSSEEVVLPRVAAALGVPFDKSFISMVPLGGRHVGHFWRLLTDLGIPHVTLLDLDRERPGGGWGRIKYAVKQLLNVGCPRDPLLAIVENGKPSLLTDADLDTMHEWPPDDDIGPWITHLETHDVFFSGPLDLDFLMQRALPTVYERADHDALGPTIPTDATAYAQAAKSVVKAVLKGKTTTAETYSTDEVRAFFWYRYLFLGRSKPSTHLHAMTQIEEGDLKNATPPVLARLVKRVNEALTDPCPAEATKGA